MDYISHHALHSHIPVHHYTHHTAVTIHQSTPIASPHLHSFSHSHKGSTHALTLCEVLFCPGYIFWAFFPVSVISVCDPGLPDFRSLNLCLLPRPLPGIVYVSALPLIFLFCLLTIAWSDSAPRLINIGCNWIRTPQTSSLTEDFAPQGSSTFSGQHL